MSASLFAVQPGDQKTLFLPIEELDITEREKTVSRKMEIERQRLQAEQPDVPLTPQQLSNTRKAALEGVDLKPGERVQGARSFFRSFDFDKGPDDEGSRTKWIKIRPAPDDVGEGLIFSDDPKVKHDQKRIYGTTGFLPDGTFAVSDIIRQDKKLTSENFPEVYPEGKSLQGFLDKVNASWNDAGYDTQIMKSEHGGLRIDKGHVIPGTPISGIFREAGANYDKNLVPQPGLASSNIGVDDTPYDRFRTAQTFDEEGGEKLWSANVPQKNTIYKDVDELKGWDLGFNLTEAYNDYIIRDDPGIIDYTKLLEPQQLGEMAHRKGFGVDELGFKYEAQNRQDKSMKWNAYQSYKAPKLSKDNPTIPSEKALAKVDTIKGGKARARGLMNLVKNTLKGDDAARHVFRGLARAAGASNNPMVNLAGDIVGAGIDGAMVIADPSVDNIADLVLSAGQVVTTSAGMVLAAVPIPGARPGAFAIMKLGDAAGAVGNVKRARKFVRQTGDALAQIERLWGMGREGRSLNKPTTPEVTGYSASDANLLNKQPSTNDLINFKAKFGKS